MLARKGGPRYGRVGAENALDDSDPFADSDDFDTPSWERMFDSQEPPPVNFATSFFIRAVPMLATLAWLGTLITLLLLWTLQDHRARYRSYIGALPFVSSVGAAHQTVLLWGTIATAALYTLSLFLERLLRGVRVLTEGTEERHLWVAVGCADVFCGLLASVALVLVGAFDSFDFPREHDAFLIAFFVCICVSGILQTTEVEHLWHEHPDQHDLRDGAFLKWTFLAFTAGTGTSSWVLQTLCHGDATAGPYERCYRFITAAAALQWAAGFITAFYFATLVLDLWPAGRHRARAYPAAWADRSGVRGVWVPQGSGEGEREGQGQVRVPQGWGVSRPHGGGARLLPPRVGVDDDDDERRDGRAPAELLMELGRAHRAAKRERRKVARR